MRPLLLHGICWICIGILVLPAAAQVQYRFENISSDQGLSNGTINAILQGKNGFMYFGTNQGLNRFDGYKFKVFIAQSGNTNSLSNNSVRSLLEDTSGDIWVGTDGGLSKYSTLTETFRSYKVIADSFGISNRVIDIEQDHAGNLWLATLTYQTRTGGLVLFDTKKNKFEKFNSDEMPDHIRAIEVDEFGNLWLAGSKGITIFDPMTKRSVKQIGSEAKTSEALFSNYVTPFFREKNGVMWTTTHSNAVTKISYNRNLDLTFEDIEEIIEDKKGNAIVSIMKDSKGNFWISTFEGVVVYNNATGSKRTLRVINNDPFSLKENGALTVFEDKSGTIWIGHGTVGISKLKNNKGFHVLNQNSDQQETLSGNNVSTLYSDKQGILWAGIVDGGVHKINFSGNYSAFPSIKRYPTTNRIVNAITRDHQGRVWIGSELYIARLDGDKFKTLSNSQYIYVFLVDHQNNFWGTSSQRLFRIASHKNGDLSYSISLPDSSLKSKIKLANYNSIFEDYSKRVWTTNWQGEIFYFDTLQNRFFAPEMNISADTTFKDTRISSCLIDRKGFFWSATLEGLGKYKIQDADGKIKLVLQKAYREKEGLTTKDGIANLYTAAIEEDNNGNIWLAQVGLSVLNPETDQIKKFDLEDGLPSNTFAHRASCKLDNEYLAFGTTNGICIFHPDSIQDNVVQPQIVLTDFQILHRSVPIKSQNSTSEDDQFALPQSITHTKELTITYDMNVLGFEFAAMDFTAPHRNQYAYQMVGFDKEWVYSGSKNTTTYTNLEPGKYTFRVKGANNDGTWNEEGTSITINILPPLWRTWWAYSLYSLSVVGLIVIGRREIVKRERLRNEVKLKQVEAEKYHELDTLKSRFFANISHEFRTPLTLLLGPIENRLAKATDAADKKELGIMRNNASRLLTLVNELLDLSRLEGGSLKLRCHQVNLNKLIERVSGQFASMADSRNINFQIDTTESIDLFADPEKIEKIITNLLSNAFKFTATKGKIQLKIGKVIEDTQFPAGSAEIFVKDTGIGINEDDLPRIFDRFYQVDNTTTRQYEGSGIGLALVKELVGLHHGFVSVQSTAGEGTCFTIRLPLGKDHLSVDELVSTIEELPISIPDTTDSLEEVEIPDAETSMPKVLVVEDNADLRHYLRSCLSEVYSISESKDGAEGFSRAVEEIPDLIISDLMMPVMDGIQLTKKLKQEEKTSHIPVILLTAKADAMTKLEGLKTGADDYMTKPFSQDELVTRIHNLITIRKNLQQKYSRQLQLLPSQIDVDSMEDRFVKKVMTVIEQYMDDNSFSVDVLAREAAMSNIQLYRKLKSVTGFTPNELIRNTRLERAASLLKQRAGNVADIAYQVGFNNLSYFSKCFKEKFGTTPSEYSPQRKDGTLL